MKWILLSCLVAVSFSCRERAEATEAKIESSPNIIWLVAEDQSPDWFPMYGDSIQSLPYLESLSKDGVIFTNAVAPVPVCAPARSAIITGMYPTTLGTHNMRTYNAYAKGENEPTIGIPSYSPVVPEGVKMFTEYLRKNGYYTSNGPKEDYNFEKTDAAWNDSSKDHHWRNRESGQPFFSVFNFSVCHESQIWARTYDSLFVDPADVKVPPYFPDTDIVRHDLAVNYSNLKRLDNQIGKILNQLKADGLYDTTYIFFYGDHGGPFPRYKRALYDSGLKVPMIIKFPVSKGAGTTDNRLFSFIDLAPTVLSLAGIEPPKVIQGSAQFGKFEVNVKPKITFHSSDRFDELYDRLRAVRSPRFKYIKNFNEDLSRALPVTYREQMATMKELRRLDSLNELTEFPSIWMQSVKPKEEFYDLEKDPTELHNLSRIPEYKDSLVYYRELLNQWIKNMKDLGEVKEQVLVQNWLIKGKQPKLKKLQLEETARGIELIHPKTGTTISWRYVTDSVWNVYVKPLNKVIPFEAKAERIGYQDSEMLNWN
ncbi:sulfatase [Maribacter sp. ACAM166]|uniref:sulfatase family protein n=1 Tax=Maribacter sp. ACAM166 TaxID=2508996 RepID=UPI0010FE907A|nr:sulfatase [Maribacter sp. ACAM166]TLP77237.1 sulfatase [Maribacter sp. ACAM166]